jgi:hypothetical protein
MRLKAAEFEINPENPFQNDALNLEESAKALTELLKSSAEESLVLSINAEWGNGKTTFLKMWEQSLKNEKFNTLYFSAWENDFTDNALISLIGELQSKITEFSKEEDSEIKKTMISTFNKVKKSSTAILKVTAPLLVKLMTDGLINLEEKNMEKYLVDFSEKIADQQIKDYETAKNTIKDFKKALEDFVKLLNKKNDQPYPLVIFIDELDRCRPLYAIELLEKAKHLFNISGIAFVLAIDKKQLGYSICSVYGQGFNVEGYLRRFIDLDYNLPQSNPKNIKMFVKQQIERFNLTEIYSSNDTIYKTVNYLEFLIFIFNPTLRNQETFFKQLSAAIKVTPKEDQGVNFPLLALLIVLKIGNPLFYENFVNNKKEAQYELIDFFTQYEPSIVNTSNYEPRCSSCIIDILIEIIKCKIYYLNVDEASKIIKQISSKIPQSMRPNVENFFNSLNNHSMLRLLGYNALESTVKKIDIASHFS